MIISYKNWYVSSALRHQGLYYYLLCPYRNLTWRKTDMNFEEKKQHIKKWLKIPKNLKSESKKINHDAVETSSTRKISKWVEKVRRDRRRTLLYVNLKIVNACQTLSLQPVHLRILQSTCVDEPKGNQYWYWYWYFIKNHATNVHGYS